jgi:mono/diheme cytochrome c family protein
MTLVLLPHILVKNLSHYSINCFVAFLLAICFLFSPATNAQQLPGTNAQQLTGKELFVGNRCVNCHTIGRGRYVGPDLYKVNERYTKEEIINWMVNSQQIYQVKGKVPINEGYPPMPPMNVNPDQAEQIHDYLTEFQIPKNRLEKGKIKGVVVNKSLSQNVSELDIKLTSYMGDKSREEYSVKSNSKGQYIFEDLRWDRSYIISLMYKGVEYATGKIVFTPEESIKAFDLPVFDTSTDDSLVIQDSSHIIIEIQEDRASVAELSVFSNGSNSVFIGNDINEEKRETLRFDIPNNADAIQFHHGISEQTSVLEDGKLISTQSVQPGISRIIFSYQIPINRETKINRKLNYLTNSQLILVSDNGYETNVEGLEGGEQVDMHNKKFLKWSGNNLKKGHEIKINISKPIIVTDYVKWIVLLVVIILIGASIGYSFYRKNRIEVQIDNHDINLESLKDSLIRDIAKLDDMFEAKDIGEQEYKKLREEKKAKLLELIDKLS